MNLRMLLIAPTLIAITACAPLHPDFLRVGMTRDALRSSFGPPAAERHDPDGDVWIYSSAPFGERASAAHLDAEGRVVRVEPLLDTQHFATIRVDAWNKTDILTHFGRPAEVGGIRGYEVWSYRYREAETWYSLFHVMFDASGVVRQTQNGPDPMFDPSFKNRF